MKKKIILLFLSMCMALTAAACSDEESSSVSENSSVTQSEETETTLELENGKIDLLLGQTEQLVVLDLAGETVTYSSNDENVVTVSADGVITATGIGTAVVKAMTASGRSALAQITVYDPEFYPIAYISVPRNEVSLTVGDEYAITYSYLYLGEEVAGSVAITSDNEGVITVANGVVKAVGVGTANVVLSGSSAYGAAVKKIAVTVAAGEIEFSSSFVGKDVYVGKPINLEIYANVNGTLNTISDVTYTLENNSIASISNNLMTPLAGGDTMVTSSFQFNGEAYTIQLPLHVYGQHTVTFSYADGTVDCVQEAVYGDHILLALQNADGNPEYNKTIKCWYVNGEEVDAETFVMPDYPVEVSVRFANDSKEDFSSSFTEGHLLNDLTGKAEYVNEEFVDGEGVSSDGGYVKIMTPNWGSVNYWFDESVSINEYASVTMRIYVPTISPLLYFGYAKADNWNGAMPSKGYEAGHHGNKTGDVPYQEIADGKWVNLTMPLSAFGEVGSMLKGVSISVASSKDANDVYVGGEIYVDYITVNHGLAETDLIYQDKVLYNKIIACANGSAAQLALIEKYSALSALLTEEEKATESHQLNVAAINAIIDAYFTYSTTTTIKDNIATATFGGELGAPTIEASASQFKGVYGTFSYMTGEPTAPTMFTMKVFDYSAYDEVEFGVAFAVTAERGILNVCGETYSIPSSLIGYWYKMKAVIADGYLTLVDAGSSLEVKVLDTNYLQYGYFFKVALPENVLNGGEGMTIGIDTAKSWMWFEVTEMNATSSMMTSETLISNVIASATIGGETNVPTLENSASKFKGKAETFSYMTGNPTVPAIFTLNKVNYAFYDEVSFYVAMAVTGDRGVLTVCGETYSIPASLIGHWYYMKAVIKNGYLMLIDAGSSSDVKTRDTNYSQYGYFFKVALPESVLNGSEALTIGVETSPAYMWFEVTEMTTVKAIKHIS